MDWTFETPEGVRLYVDNQVGLVAILEIGVTAALAAAATNWLILRRSSPRRGAGEALGERFPPSIGGLLGVVPPDERFLGVVPPEQHSPHSHLPPGQHDETDDAGGHRIYLNPWAAEDQDDW